MIDSRVGEVILAMRRLCFALARLTWITSGYGWLTIVVPAVVASPGYFGGDLTLGGLMMVVGAFNHVHWALRWFVERFPQIADWRASLLRVAAIRNALIELEEKEADQRIEHIERSGGPIRLEQLTLALADGKVLIRDVEAEIRPGDRVLIVGQSGIGKSTLFRAIGGIWPWGSGRIIRPPEHEMMFVPQHPYLPLGTLRSAIAYPAPAEAFSAEAVKTALERVGLGAFTAQIEAEERWDQELSLGEQQRLAFARLLLHRPRWAFLDEATAALDAENERRLLSLFDQELRDTSIVSIGHHASLEAFHNRVLRLVGAPDGARVVEGA